MSERPQKFDPDLYPQTTRYESAKHWRLRLASWENDEGWFDSEEESLPEDNPTRPEDLIGA